MMPELRKNLRLLCEYREQHLKESAVNFSDMATNFIHYTNKSPIFCACFQAVDLSMASNARDPPG